MSGDQLAPEFHRLSDAPLDLEFVKSSRTKSSYDIVGGGRLFAHIDITFSRKAVARSADGTWTFSRPKGLNPRRIEVTRQDSQTRTELDLRAWMRGGAVDLGGVSYDILAKAAVDEYWRCERDGRPLFVVRNIRSTGKRKHTMELSAPGRSDPNIALLLLLTIEAHVAARVEDPMSGGV